MSSNLLRGRADATAVVARRRGGRRRRAGAAGGHRRRARPTSTGPGWTSCCRTASALPDAGEPPFADTVGTMVFARSSRWSSRAGSAPSCSRGEVEVEGLTLLAVHSHAPTDPAGWLRDHAVLREAAREPRGRPAGRRLQRHARPRTAAAPGRRRLPRRRRAVQRRLAAHLAGQRALRRACRCRPWWQIDHVLTQPGLAATGADRADRRHRPPRHPGRAATTLSHERPRRVPPPQRFLRSRQANRARNNRTENDGSPPCATDDVPRKSRWTDCRAPARPS